MALLALPLKILLMASSQIQKPIQNDTLNQKQKFMTASF